MNQPLPNDVSRLKEICISQDQRIQELEDLLRLMRHNRFGRSSEKVSYSNMKTLFPEEELPEAKKPEDKKKPVKAYSRKAARKPTYPQS